MTDPRRVLHGQIHLVTARCSERRFLLKPCKATNEIFKYALARALQLTSVELYAITVQGNHFHAKVGDPKGELPRFMEVLDLLTARALNAHWGRGERFWSSDPCSNVEIHDEETLVRELVYLYTNPVKDGLVERPEQWPGFSTRPEDMGTLSILVPRPDYAFFGGKRAKRWIARGSMTPAEVRKAEAEREQAEARDREDGVRVREPRSTLPDVIPLEVKVPALIPSERHEAFRQHVRAAVELEIDRIHAHRQAEGKHAFLGVARIRAVEWWQSAGDTFPSFGLNPRIASGNEEGERQELLRGLKAWREAYRAALAAWQDGDYQVEFRLGTYGKHKVDKCQLATELILRAYPARARASRTSRGLREPDPRGPGRAAACTQLHASRGVSARLSGLLADESAVPGRAGSVGFVRSRRVPVPNLRTGERPAGPPKTGERPAGPPGAARAVEACPRPEPTDGGAARRAARGTLKAASSDQWDPSGAARRAGAPR